MATEAEQAALNLAYRERAQLVALLAALWPSTWGIDPEWTDWHVVYVQTPAGQLSWHISPNDRELFGHVPGPADTAWDGHTTAEKYQRVRDLVALELSRGGADADQAVERIEHWISEHPSRACAARFPVDDVHTVLADRAQLQRRLDAAEAATCKHDEAGD